MVAWAALIPAALSAVSAMSQKGQGQQQQAQPMMPQNPFPQNFPDGGKKTPSMMDFYGPNGMGNMNGAQPDQGGSNFMVPGGGKPLSVIDALLPGGTSPSVFNPIQDPLQGMLGGLLKGIFK